jgi:RNA polymerase sigma-70 factor, ECF subfamily
MVKQVDERVRQMCDERRFDAAAAAVLVEYGSEVFRFLVHRAHEEQLASDAFSVLSENLVRAMSAFEHRASVRTWFYTLARNALVRVSKAHRTELRRQASVSEVDLVAKSRTETPAYLRTETRQRLTALRALLPQEDQELLELRITQRFSWLDIARITLGRDEEIEGPDLKKEAARLRKRFQLARERLRDMAAAEGLLPVAGGD